MLCFVDPLCILLCHVLSGTASFANKKIKLVEYLRSKLYKKGSLNHGESG